MSVVADSKVGGLAGSDVLEINKNVSYGVVTAKRTQYSKIVTDGNTLEINQNVCYGLVPVQGSESSPRDSDREMEGIRSCYEDYFYPTNSNAEVVLERFDKEKRKMMRWILGCFSALIIVNIVSIIALVVAFALIAQLKSDIESVRPEAGSLESRLNLIEGSIETFQQTSQKQFSELTESTSRRVNSLEGDVTAASALAANHFNNTEESFFSLQSYLNMKISELSTNVNNKTMNIALVISDKSDQVIRTTEGFVNSSAILLATDIRSLYVFESCDIVSGLGFPFPSGTYRIGLSQDNFSLRNCSTSTALTCNGISGQWRRVAYLDTSQTNIECPGSLQSTTNPPSCRIFANSAICSSVLFSSGGLPYSQVCGRIYRRCSGTPDAFDIVFPGDRPPSPTIDDNYVDGISISYGMNPRNHVWTLATTTPQLNRDGCISCNYLVPGFIGSDYSCQIVTDCSVQDWNDYRQCNGTKIFYRNLTQTTTLDLEMRLCRDQARSDEDISISFIEIFVSAP